MMVIVMVIIIIPVMRPAPLVPVSCIVAVLNATCKKEAGQYQHSHNLVYPSFHNKHFCKPIENHASFIGAGSGWGNVEFVISISDRCHN
jgi:hypothetical protein